MKRILGAFVLAFALGVCAFGMFHPAEAVKVKVEVDVDEDTPSTPSKKTPMETFPVTLNNRTGDRVFVSLLYFDGNAKKWRCRGWWGVDAHKERSFKLSHVPGKNIYYYVQRNGRRFSPTGTSGGVNWDITKQKFSYYQGAKVTLDKPFTAHFVRGGTGSDGWWRLNINP